MSTLFNTPHSRRLCTSRTASSAPSIVGCVVLFVWCTVCVRPSEPAATRCGGTDGQVGSQTHRPERPSVADSTTHSRNKSLGKHVRAPVRFEGLGKTDCIPVCAPARQPRRRRSEHVRVCAASSPCRASGTVRSAHAHVRASAGVCAIDLLPVSPAQTPARLYRTKKHVLAFRLRFEAYIKDARRRLPVHRSPVRAAPS